MCGHDVQFYRTDAYLTRAVVDFLATGLRAGQPLIVIATEPHRRAFAEGLRAQGVDPEELFSDRFVLWLDARSALSSFMEGGMPNRELFQATVGSVFEKVLDKRSYVIVRAYGEMVDLLASEGNVDGAVMLERLWNELADRYRYSLLCGYSVDRLFHHAGEDGLSRVLSHHTHVLPLEAIDGHAA
jgi:MEDS: MEthanogen/methylotroph, DcmR Sensory domain